MGNDETVTSDPTPSTPAVGELAPRFDGIERIAVLRGGGLGDVLFAVPAMSALKAAYPSAAITLLGMPMHRALFAGRPSPVDEVIELPFARGVRDGEEDASATSGFFDALPPFDLAVQVHGGGRNSNPFLLRLGATHTVGLATPDAAPLERTLPYIYYQHEVLRALEVAGLAGAAPVGLEPRLTATDAERERARALRGADRQVVVHPGATDVRRHWPAERFAEVARRLAADGIQVLVVGDRSDVPAAEEIVAAAASDLVSSVAGTLPLGDLVGIAAECDVVLGNDSGPRHLAQAAGAATVGVFWVGNLINAGPLSRGRHRVQLSWTTHCPICGRDATQVGWTAERCEHELSFVTDVATDAVEQDVRALLDSR